MYLNIIKNLKRKLPVNLTGKKTVNISLEEILKFTLYNLTKDYSKPEKYSIIQKLMRIIKGLFKLIRFELSFSAGLCVIMGQSFALGTFASAVQIISGFASVFFISSSILVLNDYFDLETDKINAPDRPIPMGLISQSEALFISIMLLAAGLLISYLISGIALIIAVIMAITGYLYNRHFKRSGLPGNIMVSISVGMTFIYGGATVGLPLNKIVIIFSLIAALIDLGEEIASDAMDVKGDILIDSKSLAINYGKPAALRVSVIIFSVVILLSMIPFLLEWFTVIYLIPIGLMDLSIAFGAFRLLNSENEEGRKFIRWIYLGATAGLMLFLLMKLAGI